MGFPGGLDGKASARNVGDLGSIPERSPGEGNGNPLQYSCLENHMDRQRSPWESDTTERLHFTFFPIICRWTGCFRILTIVNNAAVNMGNSDFISFGYTSRSGIAESCSTSVFDFLRKLYPVFLSGCASLHFHWRAHTSFLSLHLLTSTCYLLSG